MFSQPVYSRDFFLREPLEVARDLLGAELITVNKQGTTSGMIIEVEAYAANDIDLMRRRRGVENIKNLTSGPGKLCQALSIKAGHNGEDFLSSSKIMLSAGKRIDDSRIRSSARIGISKAVELPYRLLIEDPEMFK